MPPLLPLLALLGTAAPSAPARPNVILIVTDDQGYGDVGFHGNPVLKTPRLDRLAAEGVELRGFRTYPVCAPTRAALLTGRHAYRTRVVDTYLGRAMMDPAEVTLAERLAPAGYRCAIVGKWHLGDCAPMRPQDQGFHEALVHRGGGIGQPSDPPGGSHYTDPILFRDGKPEMIPGYVTDILADEAIRFVERNQARPFYLHLAFNAPHTPLDVPEPDVVPYRAADLAAVAPPYGTLDPEATARLYAMIGRVDSAVGRLLDRLDALGLADSTLVVFLSDNGPQQPRWNAGLRGLKGTVFEGGLRVPALARWPGRLPAGRVVDDDAAIIDLVPTILEACGVEAGARPVLDGRSLWPLLTGASDRLCERPFVTQWHRGDVPEPGRGAAVVAGRWKLTQPVGADGGPLPDPSPGWMLFDLQADPFERVDVADEHPGEVARLQAHYDAWFRDVSSTRGFDPPRIVVGAAEPVTTLTRQDWRGPRAGWDADSLGHWEIDVARPGPYRARVEVAPAPSAGRLRVRVGGVEQTVALEPGASMAIVDALEPAPGPTRFEAVVERPAASLAAAPAPATPVEVGVLAVEIERSGG